MQWFLWLLAFLLSLGAGYWVYRADVKRAIPYPWLTSSLRGLIVLLTLLLLIAPAITIQKNETEKPLILFLQDESRSIQHALGKDTNAYRKNAENLIEKLSADYKVLKVGFGNHFQNDSLFAYRQHATDIADALQKAEEYYGMQNMGAIILPTDGRYNQGSNPQFQQLSIKAPIYTVGIGDTTARKDLLIQRTYANKVVAANSRFEIKADILATLCNGYSNSAQVLENGTIVANTSLNINNDRFDRSISFTLTAAKAGLHHYVINLPAAEGETNTGNNKRDVFVEVVEERKHILIAAAAPHPDINAIKEALSGKDAYKITVRTGTDIPTSFGEYDVIIAHQLPAQGQNNHVIAYKKPIWYIVGTQTNLQQLSQLQTLAILNPGNVSRNIFAAYNTSFNNFTLPQTLQSVLDKMPPLSVPASSMQVSPAANVLFQQKTGEPLPIWIMQPGAVPIAMLMGEGLWRWRIHEYKNFNSHEVVDECIRQTISFLAANANDKPFRVVLPKYIWSDQEAINLNAYLLNANNEQVNKPDAQLVITDSAGRKQNFSFERSGTSYRINTGILPSGSYTYTATTNYNGKPYSSTGSFIIESVPLELMETGANYPLLAALSAKYNGSFVPASNITSLYDSIKKNTNIKPIIQTNTETIPLVDWKWYFFLILVLAVAEWLLRKYWLAQ